MSQEQFEKRKKIICDLLDEEMYVPMKEKELAAFLQVEKEEREEFKMVLNSLLSEGKVQISKHGRYSKQEEHIITGNFICHPKGFGFVEVEGIAEDYYIPQDRVHGAFHQDKVQVQLLPGQRGKRQEAEIVKILERGISRIVGTYQKSKNFGFVVPDNSKFPSDVFIPQERSKGAVEGHKVVIEITNYGTDSKNPEGKIVEILGHINDPGVDILSIIKGFELPTEFGERIMNQAEKIPDEIQDADRVGRLDLTSERMVTIDGEDAKDLDDAVSLHREGENYVLGVHIADVSNYVQENSALDKEALKRGTSVYLVDRVIPMLPHKLSNGICSLNEGVDRLALSCMMTLTKTGEVADYKIAETVICVDRRMSYTNVAKILEQEDTEAVKEYQDFVTMFQDMEKLAAILRKKRKKRGSIDFDLPETKIILDKEGHPTEIKPYDRNIATKIIEDFMLIANETVAQHYYWLELPFVYRTHEKPDPEKIAKLSLFLQNFGHFLKSGKEEIHPKELQKLLEKVEGTSEEALVSRLTLRSMKQARYSVDCAGHFGLACQYYCHFTSPIRRYPDLQIHRIIKEQLRGRLKEGRLDHYEKILPETAKQSSLMERRSTEAERETDKLKKAEYMEERIGNVYEGVISGIMNWGIYVELPNTIEGMIHVSVLPGDYYFYDEETYEMVGESTGKRYQLGEHMKVQVNKVDKFNRTIDFIVPEE